MMQLCLHFPGGNCVTWKKNRKKASNIYDNIHQDLTQKEDHAAAGQLMIVTEILVKVGQGKHLQQERPA